MQGTKLTRVWWLRNRADEIRRTADGMQHAKSRASLLQTAENYEKFARRRIHERCVPPGRPARRLTSELGRTDQGLEPAFP